MQHPVVADLLPPGPDPRAPERGEQPASDAAVGVSTPLNVAGSLSALALAACGGGNDDGNPAEAQSVDGNASRESLAAGATRAAAVPTAAQASAFLQQAQFSASDDDIATVIRLGYDGWLKQQFDAPPAPGAWDWLMSNGYNTDVDNKIHSGERGVWQQLIAAPNAVRCRVALALSEIFVVSVNGFNNHSFTSAAYWDLLARNAFGNFRNLLEDVTLSWAMGSYLNTLNNLKSDPATGREPDQNYAREVMQLFTIGLYELNDDGTPRTDSQGRPIETYDQETVRNLAKVFTGWVIDTTGDQTYANPVRVRNPMVMRDARHEMSAASFLGVTVPAGTGGKEALKIALDALFSHANAGPFFARRLIQRLVSSNPSSAYVKRVATAFNRNAQGVRGDLKTVLRAVLLDPEARGTLDSRIPGLRESKLREPMVRFIQWARTFQAFSLKADYAVGDLSSVVTGLGQSPLRSPSVFNFFRPGYVPPGTELALKGMTAPEFQITDQTTVACYINFMEQAVNNRKGGLSSNYAQELPLVHDIDKLLARLNLLLCAGKLSANTLEIIEAAVNAVTLNQPDGAMKRVKTAIFLVMISPEYIVQK